MFLQFAFLIFQSESGGASIAQFLPLIGIMLVFYFIMFRPQQKRQKEMKQMQANLKNGDRVLTSSGVHGTIVGLRDDYVVLRVPPDSVKLEIQRSTVLELENPTPENS